MWVYIDSFFGNTYPPPGNFLAFYKQSNNKLSFMAEPGSKNLHMIQIISI